jgi:hypothetical protein
MSGANVEFSTTPKPAPNSAMPASTAAAATMPGTSSLVWP